MFNRRLSLKKKEKATHQSIPAYALCAVFIQTAVSGSTLIASKLHQLAAIFLIFFERFVRELLQLSRGKLWGPRIALYVTVSQPIKYETFVFAANAHYRKHTGGGERGKGEVTFRVISRLTPPPPDPAYTSGGETD